jgi:hypothetical protein
VHHPKKMGKHCDNQHRENNRQLFYKARTRHSSVPAAVADMMPQPFNETWAWLFQGTIPGLLQFHAKMNACNAPRTLA